MRGILCFDERDAAPTTALRRRTLQSVYKRLLLVPTSLFGGLAKEPYFSANIRIVDGPSVLSNNDRLAVQLPKMNSPVIEVVGV